MSDIFDGILENNKLNIQFLIDGKNDGWIDLNSCETCHFMFNDKAFNLKFEQNYKSLLLSYHTKDISFFIYTGGPDNLMHINHAIIIHDSFKIKDLVSIIEYIGSNSVNVKKLYDHLLVSKSINGKSVSKEELLHYIDALTLFG